MICATTTFLSFSHRLLPQYTSTSEYNKLNLTNFIVRVGPVQNEDALGLGTHLRAWLAKFAIRNEQNVRICPFGALHPLQAPLDGLIEVGAPVEYCLKEAQQIVKALHVCA